MFCILEDKKKKMIQRRSAKLLTSSQAVSTQPRAILGLLLVRNQMLVTFAACERPRYQIPSSLSPCLPLFLYLVLSLSLHNVRLRRFMCALHFMHKLICISIFVFCASVCVCMYMYMYCVCVCT